MPDEPLRIVHVRPGLMVARPPFSCLRRFWHHPVWVPGLPPQYHRQDHLLLSARSTLGQPRLWNSLAQNASTQSLRPHLRGLMILGRVSSWDRIASELQHLPNRTHNWKSQARLVGHAASQSEQISLVWTPH